MIYSRLQDRCRINILSSQLEIGDLGLRPSKRASFWAVPKKTGGSMKMAIKGLGTINY